MPKSVSSVGSSKKVDPATTMTYDPFGLDDTDLHPHVQHGIHALALDEQRFDFFPTLFRLPDPAESERSGQTLVQMWFSGCHSDVGGGHLKQDLGDLSLAWMVAETEGILDFDHEYLKKLASTVVKHGGQVVKYQWGTALPAK